MIGKIPPMCGWGTFPLGLPCGLDLDEPHFRCRVFLMNTSHLRFSLKTTFFRSFTFSCGTLYLEDPHESQLIRLVPSVCLPRQEMITCFQKVSVPVFSKNCKSDLVIACYLHQRVFHYLLALGMVHRQRIKSFQLPTKLIRAHALCKRLDTLTWIVATLKSCM